MATEPYWFPLVPEPPRYLGGPKPGTLSLGTPCPPSLEGGMCGCDEPQDSCPEGVCLSSECDC